MNLCPMFWFEFFDNNFKPRIHLSPLEPTLFEAWVFLLFPNKSFKIYWHICLSRRLCCYGVLRVVYLPITQYSCHYILRNKSYLIIPWLVLWTWNRCSGGTERIEWMGAPYITVLNYLSILCLYIMYFKKW